MEIVVPPAQELVGLIGMIALTDWTAPKLHLFSNNITPTPDNILADFTECVYSGYAAEAVTYGAPYVDVNGIPVVNGGEKLFAQNGATGDVCFGAFLTNTGGTKLLWAGRLNDPPFSFINDGDTLALTFKMSVNNGLLAESPVP